MGILGFLRGPREVLFGPGQRYALGTVTASLGSRALVCTDARLGGTDEFAELVRLIEDAGVHVTVFAEVLPDVPVHQVAECAELANRVRPDVVVGMGGGSCLDLAKAVAVVIAHGGQASDYYGETPRPGTGGPRGRPAHHGGHRVGGDARGGADRPRARQQGRHLQPAPRPAHGRVRPGSSRSGVPRRSPRARGPTRSRTRSSRSPRYVGRRPLSSPPSVSSSARTSSPTRTRSWGCASSRRTCGGPWRRRATPRRARR